MWVQKIVIFGQCLVVNWKRYKIRAQYYGTATQKKYYLFGVSLQGGTEKQWW